MKKIGSIVVLGLTLAALSAGVSAQNLNLTSLAGEKVNVEGRRDTIVVLAIGASWLPLSRDQIVIANKLARKYAGRKVVVYFVATDSVNARSRNFASDDDLRAFVTRNKLSAEVLRDPDGLLTLKRYGVDQLPSFVVLDKNGKISGEPFSGIDPENDLSVPISKAIDKILN